jgi:hypothetical protein
VPKKLSHQYNSIVILIKIKRKNQTQRISWPS